MAGIRVRLPPSRERAKSLSEVELTFIHVWEPEPPPGEAAIEWKLITTEPADLETIEQTVDWYRARWTIEELFKALKTGCAVEKRQLETFDALTRAVTFFMPMAWHMLFLRHQARHAPDTPAEQVISPVSSQHYEPSVGGPCLPVQPLETSCSPSPASAVT